MSSPKSGFVSPPSPSITRDVMEEMTIKKGTSRAGTNYLTEQEEKQLFKTIKSRKGTQAERDFCLLKLCRMTGLRRGEALALNVGDVKGKTVLEVTARIAEKGGIGNVAIPVELQLVIDRLLNCKRKWGENLAADAPLFVSKKGARLSARTFNDLMDKWCREAGLPRYTPHALRHTKARRIMDDYMTIPEEQRAKKLNFAQKQLRHRNITSTAIYTEPSKEEMDLVGGI